MESTLFTTLTTNEEANLSGGNKSSNKATAKVSLIKSLIKLIFELAGRSGSAGIVNIGSGNVIVTDSNINVGDGAIVTSPS
ncbi:MAG: hypothetical protein HWQ41_17205 [Nostoc sp. NOS(2021)]|uniref:hypothetical protein n=1 Tax=Nostoc sp. NOS(2021) TaxID=2815407 RepID=UPI0025E912DB|nr:hypothetical protein [Nostoc sp. NOS(2021)]MBN3896941.1 hypothetical protein [Nostoc sp. NOS(2021)]